ncbi:MAG: aminoacetone oxidase family FAD-binding enzyme [Corallococcus sp.]|nr:aminoacetone oxidase family FAD-binding enzyme [Corallococcus sp.]
MNKVIIGGGMSGLVCAIAFLRCNDSVTVIEKNSRVGKKISVTGNGRCNICNLNVTHECYNDSALVRRIISAVTPQYCLRFLESIGIYTYADQSGRVYPVTDNANSVVDCLRYACEHLGAKILCGKTAVNMSRKNGRYCVLCDDGSHLMGDEVILACGSGSQSVLPDPYGFVPKNKFTPVRAGLTPLKTVKPIKGLNGLRTKAKTALLADGIVLAESAGELQFKDYGLSGICIFDLSSVIARRAVGGKESRYEISVDLAPEFTQSDLESILTKRICDGVGREQLFYGILHNKIAEAVISSAEYAHGDAVSKSTRSLAYTAKNIRFEVDRQLDFSKSQVSVGGVDEKHLDGRLATEEGVRVIGEILNADGICGGYNLYFAIASALYLLTEEQRKGLV